MNEEKKQRYLIALISMLFLTGIVGTRPLIPLLSHELYASAIEIGIIISLYSFLPFILAVKVGKVVDKIGCKQPIIISVIIGGIALFIPYFFLSMIGIYFSQILAGIAQLLFVVAAQSFAGSNESDKVREKNVLFFSLGVAIGSFLGPLIGGLFSDILGYRQAFGILTGVSLSSLLFIYILRDTKQNKKDQIDKANEYKTLELFQIQNLRKAFLLSMLVLLGKDMYIAFFPLLLKENNASDSLIGTIIAIHSAAGIISRWGLPKLLEYMNRHHIIVLTIVSSGLCFVFMAFMEGYVFIAILSFLLGVALGIAQPLSVSTTINYLPKNRIGEGLGVRLSLNRLTQMSSPLVLGFVAQFFGIISVFVIVGSCLMFGTAKLALQKNESTLICQNNKELH
ncbi:MFS transporter [Anaerobacillus sp. MEB173]|uniref:MFS transporter n=1 Tax=Anaerobacillus sp. MEB173 TaxID=3383345 RepID=UPI003F8D99D7